MNPILIFRKGFTFLLLLQSFAVILAQTPEDLQLMGKDAEGFTFKLKFKLTPSVLTANDAKYQRITALLQKYKRNVPDQIQQRFRVQGAAAAARPVLSPDEETVLKQRSVEFFREMATADLTLWDLQQYKDIYKNLHPVAGDNPTDPQTAWGKDFQSIERTMMGGRTLMIMDVWKQTMMEFFSKHPEAAGVVYGQMDIGSWVKMNVDGLGFAADIDFSTIATDNATNKALHDLFATNLENASGLKMIPLDVVHTAHGIAGAEVFIGEWGKAFAEVDMLRRGKWKLIELVKNENGAITDIRTIEKDGRELFMQKAGELETQAAQKDPANSFDPKEKYPELKIDMEPMLSLEMLRHAMHDVEHGPFQGGQKIIKMIKYTERSFFMVNEALKTVPVKDAMLYFNLTPEEQKFMTLCDEVIKNKTKPDIIVKLLEDFSGKTLEHNEQVNLLEAMITEKCKNAMLKNAGQSFGYRIRNIAEITDENQRYDEADRFLKQMEEEFNKGYREGGTEIPKSMLRAHSILTDLRAGKISPDLVNARLEELNKIMADEYKVDKSFIERIVGDPWGPVRKFLQERGYGPEAVQKMLGGIKESFATNWKKYAPEYAQRSAMSAYEYAGIVNKKLTAFNEHLAKTKAGKVLGNEMLNQLDNAFALYDAWMSGADLKQSAYRVSWTAGTLWAQGKWPFLAIPLGVYNSIQERSVGPAAMAVTFYLFPMAGQAYMVTSLIDRIVVSNVRDLTFRNHLDRLAMMAETDGEGHVKRFKVARAFQGLTGSPDSLETDPDISSTEPDRTTGIKRIFQNEAFLYCPDIKYFNGLVPARTDQFGLYDKKLKDMMTLFSFDPEFVGYLTGIEKFKKEKDDGTLPDDEAVADRAKMLDSLELIVEDHMWSVIFTAIESTKNSEKKGALDELEATILRLQDSLLMGDFNMKQIDSLGLLQKVRKVIQNDPMYYEALKNKYAAGTAYDRVAFPVMERYISVYRQIQVIQNKIFEVWRPFGVDPSALQAAPMRLLLMGGTSGAPMLTTDPDKDMQAAIQALEAHTKRASQIRMDLSNALGRPVNETTDKEHLRILGEYGFGFEHLVDADVNGRSPAFKGETGSIVKAMQEKTRLYKEYLEKLKEVPSLTLKLSVKGEKTTTETNPVLIEATVINEKKQEVPLPAGTTIEWNTYKDNSGTLQKVAEGKSFTHPADTKGSFTYIIKLLQQKKDKTEQLDIVYWDITVKPIDVADPSKGVKLTVPGTIRQYDIVDVSAEIPAAFKSRIASCRWGYNAIAGDSNCNAAKLQFNTRMEQRDENGKTYLLDSINVEYDLYLNTPGVLYPSPNYVYKKVKYQHMTINVKTTDIWEGGAGADWFHLQRKTINSAPRVPAYATDNKMVSTASAYALVEFKKDDPFHKPADLAGLKTWIENENDLAHHKELELKEISVGDFKGYAAFSPPRYAPGGWSFEGYRGAGASASLSGYVMKGIVFFKVIWYANASGAFDNSDQGWMMSMVRQLSAEASGIFSGASFQPDGQLTKSPYTGPKLDGSDYPQVRIDPKTDTLQPGKKFSVKAVIEKDKAEYGPYTYTWTGDIDGKQDGNAVWLNATRPGKKTVSVTVDGTVPPGSATMEYVVAPLKVRLVLVKPNTKQVPAGMPVELRAEFISPVPAGSKLLYRWQPHPEENFEPFESNSNTTKVIFTKPGIKKIWVQVLDQTTADVFTMGESDQLELEVLKPTFTLKFDPPKAQVGQTVTATISTPVKLEDADYRWMPLPANAKQLGGSSDGSSISFYAKDAMKIDVSAIARVKGSGEELGNISGTFNADRYLVGTTGPNVQGPKPMVWKPGEGLVEVEKEIAVHQIVEFTATVTPQPAGTLTYQWEVLQGNASISNPASRDMRITALETGNIEAKITVKDNNGVILGSSTCQFNATVSDDMIRNAGTQQKAFDDKMTEARQFLKDGKLDEAFTAGEALKGMNAKAAAPFLTDLAEACKKAAKNAVTERDFDLAIKRCNQSLQLNPNDAATRAQLDQYKKWAKEWPAILAKGDELEAAVRSKNLPATEKLINDLNHLQLNMPGQMGNKWSQEKSDHYVKLLRDCDVAWTSARTEWTKNFKDKDWAAGLKGLEAFRNEWTAMGGTMKEVESSIQLCKTQIADQTRIYNDFLTTKTKFEQGLPVDPKQNAVSIQYTALNHFSGQDPRQKEMLDFAAGMDRRQKEIISNRTRATELKNSGLKAENAGQKEDAVRDYKESVALVPDADLDNRIKKLESDLAVIHANKAKADDLWNAGDKLTQKKKTKKEGLDKMKESLTWWNSPERIARVRDLETELNGSASSVDISGIWKHGNNNETFTFSPTGNGTYTAIEKGFDNATGIVNQSGRMAIIDYQTHSGLTGQYILQISEDGNTASATWKDSRNNSGQRVFQRVSKPVTKEPEQPVTTNPPEKKKKGLGNFISKVGKGLDKIDSTLSGKKPADNRTGIPDNNPANNGNNTNDKGVEPADASVEEKVFDNWNIYGVSSRPSKATVFTLSKTTYVTRIENYHYLNNGVRPGTIALRNTSGQTFGPWQSYGIIGQGGVQNAIWVAQPNMQIPAGTYTVIDSDPSTWSVNSQSNGCGFTNVWAPKNGKKPVPSNQKDYTIEEVETGGGVKAEKIFITGDIDNLGFGFPAGFDVFSGNSTPSHGYPWKTDPNDAKGTDRIMVGSGARTNSDGYSSTTARADNQPQAITLYCSFNETVSKAVLQLFVDDFQATAIGSKFSVTINGRRAAFLENVLNSLNQTGPVGKLVSVNIPADFLNEIGTGKLVIFIDDATSGLGDGYAVDFVRLILNPTAYTYTGTITGIIYRPDGQPASGAQVSAGGIINSSTNSKGEFTLNNVPAGMVSLTATYNNHHQKTITTDLASGKTIRITINLPAD